MSFTSDSEPLSTLKTLLQTYWESFLETPVPQFVISNDLEGEFLRANYNISDYIILATEGTENIRYRGNYQYYDKSYPINILIGTKHNRQRLRDLWKMIRQILFDKKHNFTSWQLVRMLSYTEMTNQDQSIWRALVRIQLESAGVSADSLS